MNVVFETDRLLLRNFTEEDAPLLYELNLDPEVTRYTLDPVVDLGHAKKILQEVILPQYGLYNHGRWAVHLKPNLEFIGWCGLKSLPERQEVDLGYRFMKRFWGQGFATESAVATLNFGFKSLYVKRIVGRALPGNKASIKVLQKCGMSYLGQEVIEGLLHETYELINPHIR
jgi:RimJ/RimL family protein N-acetyltransferase